MRLEVLARFLQFGIEQGVLRGEDIERNRQAVGLEVHGLLVGLRRGAHLPLQVGQDLAAGDEIVIGGLDALLDLAAQVGLEQRRLPQPRPSGADVILDGAPGEDRQVGEEDAVPLAGVGVILLVEIGGDIERDRRIILGHRRVDGVVRGLVRRRGGEEILAAGQARCSTYVASAAGGSAARVAATSGPSTSGAPMRMASVRRPLRRSFSAWRSSTWLPASSDSAWATSSARARRTWYLACRSRTRASCSASEFSRTPTCRVEITTW